MRLEMQDWDVVVLGGGVAGLAAGAEAAGAGARTLVIERRPALGWEVSWAHAPGLAGGQGRLFDALRQELTRAGPPAVPAQAGGLAGHRPDPAMFELALELVLARRGPEVLQYAQPLWLHERDGRATAAVVATKSGTWTFRARAFVDATEGGLFWSGPPSVPAAATPGRFSVYVWAPSASRQSVQGEGWRLEPAGRPPLVELSYQTAGLSVADARLRLPAVLQAVRAPQGPLPPEAIVTHTSPELLPLGGHRRPGAPGEPHARIANLFGAGLWLMEPCAAEEIAGRLLAAGAASGAAAARLASGVSLAPVERPAAFPVVPPRHTSQVLVVGGGTAGALAAVAAARRGVAVTLLEAGTCLGGMGTGGAIHSYYYGLTGGLQDEVDQRVAAIEPLFAQTRPRRCRGFHPEAKKVVLETLVREAGVALHYSQLVYDVTAEPVLSALPVPADRPAEPMRRVRHVLAAGPGGGRAFEAEVFIDSTGDADLAARAGAECRFGREADGLLHAYTQSAGLVLTGEKAGPEADAVLAHHNFDAGYVDPTDSEDLTRARREGLRLLAWGEDQVVREVPIFIAPLLGLRNGRQIVGDATLTLADVIAGRRFPDAVAETWGHFDDHATDYQFESDEAVFWVWVLGHWHRRVGCEIPYGVMLPRGLEGVLVACRGVSITQDVHYQFRMQRDMQRLGEAAGIAAALAVRSGSSPRAIDVQALRAELVRGGALAPPGAPPQFRHKLDEDQAASPPPERLLETLAGPQASEALLPLVQRGAGDDQARALLEQAARSALPAVRFRASAALAMQMNPAGAAGLIRTVEERLGLLQDKGIRLAPAWYSAIVLLGRLGAREAVPALIQVIESPDTPFEPFVAAVRALGRIGDPAAVPALLQCLERQDVRALAESRSAAPGTRSRRWDRRWQLDLTLAEALGRLDVFRLDLVAPYLDDPRALVRRQAQRVREHLEKLADRAAPGR